MVELYIHNMILTDMKFWDPYSILGDMQPMELASWLTYKEIRVEEVKRVMTKDENDAFYIRAELVSPKAIINNKKTSSLIPNQPLSAWKHKNNLSSTLRTHLGCWGLKSCKLSKGYGMICLTVC